ncbi:MAG: metalloregulator ArsR/SmtB family transcription factor [Bdellovibrionales bacterium]|nr:metalloregulator ArsR/SmtB family transcription factor [Bdellovibrionales bacterium]
MVQTPPSTTTHEALTSCLKALGDDSRLRIVHLLSKGSFNVQELTTALSLSQSTVSHHLKILERSHLVSPKKEGSWSFYSLNSDRTSFEAELLQLIVSAISRSDKLSQQLETDNHEIEKVLHSRRDRARAYFETVAREWDSLREEAQGKAEYLSLLKEKVPQNGTLLELGCGSGSLLAQLLPRNGATIGVDYSDAMIREARQQLSPTSSSNPVDLRLGYLEHLPVGDESIDHAVACMVFHHIAEPLAALRDTFRVLRPGGTLTVVDLTAHTNELMRERFADLWLGFHTDEFVSWLELCGFETPKITVLEPEMDVFLLETVKKDV